jgi:hypothetical protein
MIWGANYRFRAYLLTSSPDSLRSQSMPHRRKPEKGSFGGHFDELVKHFPGEQLSASSEDKDVPPERDGSVDDRLFESTWRKSRNSAPRL